MYHSPHSAPPPLQKPAPPSNAVKGLLIITLAIIISLGAGICIGSVSSTNQQARVLEQQRLLAQVLVSRYEGIHTITFRGCNYSMNYGTTYWYSSNNYSTGITAGGHPGDFSDYTLKHAHYIVQIEDIEANRQGWFAGDPSTGMRYRDTDLDYRTASLADIALTTKPCFG